MKTKLQQLEEKIRELCPELMELSFGCKIICKDGKLNYLSRSQKFYWLQDDTGEILEQYEVGNCKVIGHPITLEHCRIAIERSREGGCNQYYFDMSCAAFRSINNAWKDLKPWKQQHEVRSYLQTLFLYFLPKKHSSEY